VPKQKGPKRDKAEKNRIAALKAQKARKGGPAETAGLPVEIFHR
jgi:hypothetical protein